MERLRARSGPGVERERATIDRAYGDVVSSLPYEDGLTLSWPLSGGPAAWDDLAARVMFECRSD
jgi:hypothetical protein